MLEAIKAELVSTHSRLKAAGNKAAKTIPMHCFNTQPPEGGCSGCLKTTLAQDVSTHSRLKAADLSATHRPHGGGFNTQPPEGGWFTLLCVRCWWTVSTHSRLKAAGSKTNAGNKKWAFQHTAA